MWSLPTQGDYGWYMEKDKEESFIWLRILWVNGKEWERDDAQLLSQILNNLELKAQHVSNTQIDCKKMWDCLEELYLDWK